MKEKEAKDAETKKCTLKEWLLLQEVGARSSGRLTAVGDLLQ